MTGFIVSPGGFAPPAPPPPPPPRGFAPPAPPARSLAGAPGPAPLAWLTRVARSRVSLSTAPSALTTWTSRLLQQRVPRRIAAGPLRLFGARHHIRDDLSGRLNLVGIENLGVSAVGDPQAQVHRLQLLVDVEPRTTPRFHGRQRTEQRVDR